VSETEKLDLPCDKLKAITNLDTKRGELIHKILEYIFDIEDKENWLAEFLKNFGLEFNEDERAEIFGSIMNFVCKTGKIQGENEVEILFSGKLLRVDKVYITEESISISDYKTGRDNVINHKISSQLELYKYALGKIYPQKEISAKVEWI
jgi:ATP-dependent exoDNAse (exonuclease V) beta subunit